MELKTFVSESILEIMRGVKAAQESAVSEKLGRVYPKFRMAQVPSQWGGNIPEATADPVILKDVKMILTQDGDGADLIEFDVAVTVQSSETRESGQETGGKGGVSIKVVEVGLDSNRTESSGEASARSHETRIKFRVPVCFSKS